MSTELTGTVDLEDHEPGRVPFGRNRALGVLGAALFGLVVSAVTPKGADATHLIPYPCHGFDQCANCSGSTCTDAGCRYVGYDLGCDTPGQCWYTCSGSTLWKCCDWYSPYGNYNGDLGKDPHFCICRGWAGDCPCSTCV